MRLQPFELGLVVLVIGYIAFYTNPPPRHIADFVSSPVGSVITLLGVLYVTTYQSLVVGVFLALAYIMTVKRLTEYLENPSTADITKLAEMVKSAETLTKATEPVKGDTRLDSVSQKKGTPLPELPVTTSVPKPDSGKVEEHFASF
jgi:hypothetical protein